MEIKDNIMIIEHQMEMHKLYAHLHMTKATTGEYKKRVGNAKRSDGYIYTEDDLLTDTIETAQRHIKHYIDCADHYHELLEKRGK